MIIEGIFNLITSLLNSIPFDLPTLPLVFNDGLQMIFDGIIASFNILAIFINIDFWFNCTFFMLTIYNIKFIYNIFVYLINLIPSINLKTWH